MKTEMTTQTMPTKVNIEAGMAAITWCWQPETAGRRGKRSKKQKNG